MNTVRSALCTVSFYVWSIFMGLVMIPMLLTPRPVFRWLVLLWSGGNFFIFRVIC